MKKDKQEKNMPAETEKSLSVAISHLSAFWGE